MNEILFTILVIIVVYCSAGSTTSSGLKGLTTDVGALRVIEPFSIHNICLSVRALHQQ
jgi:hypothetical protein